MAQQAGILGLRGTVGGLVFAKDGSVRQKPASNKAAFASAASMQRTRENAAEFGIAAGAGKLVRQALRQVIASASDARLTSRLQQKMKFILNLDEDADRGGRQVLPENLTSLVGFDFNAGAILASTYFGGYQPTIDRTAGNHTVALAALVPGRDIAAPQGTTHYRLNAAVATLNFETGAYGATVVSTAEVPVSNELRPAETLTLTLPVGADDAVVVAVGIDFFQLVNGKLYALQNNTYNPLSVVAVG